MNVEIHVQPAKDYYVLGDEIEVEYKISDCDVLNKIVEVGVKHEYEIKITYIGAREKSVLEKIKEKNVVFRRIIPVQYTPFTLKEKIKIDSSFIPTISISKFDKKIMLKCSISSKCYAYIRIPRLLKDLVVRKKIEIGPVPLKLNQRNTTLELVHDKITARLELYKSRINPGEDIKALIRIDEWNDADDIEVFLQSCICVIGDRIIAKICDELPLMRISKRDFENTSAKEFTLTLPTAVLPTIACRKFIINNYLGLRARKGLLLKKPISSTCSPLFINYVPQSMLPKSSPAYTCPYCGRPLDKKYKICPYCKRESF